MDVSKITRKEMAEFLEVSPQGFDHMINNESMKVSKLEKVAEILKVNICSFFREDNDYFNEDEANYGSEYVSRKDFDYLKKQCELKDGQILFLQNLISENQKERTGTSE